MAIASRPHTHDTHITTTQKTEPPPSVKSAPAPPPPIKTVQEEQLERSAEIEKIGVEAYKEKYRVKGDEEAEAARVTPGVGAPTERGRH